jgi:hypothetical protein
MPTLRTRSIARLTTVGAVCALALTAAPLASAGQPPAPSGQALVAADSADLARSAAAVRVPRNVRFYQGRSSVLGLHRWYRQVHQGHPVAGGWWGWHRERRTGKVTVWDGRRNVGKLDVEQPLVGAGRATSVAAKTAGTPVADVNGSELMVLPPSADTAESRLVWAVASSDGRGALLSYVDAATGEVLKTELSGKFKSDKGRFVKGKGKTFDPNPPAKLQRQDLRDRGDRASAVPKRAYTKRDLYRLRKGQHTLVGKWVRIMNRDRVVRPNNRFNFKRSDDRFEQVNAYHSIDALQQYLQRLGFKEVNAESQKIRTNAFAADNSFYDPSIDEISMGRGGVDDAEDPEVLWHEYGHAIQDDQVPDWGRTFQGSAMGEAFGDYIAVTMSQATRKGTAKVPTGCVMDWDATSYSPGPTHCLRRTDLDLTFPQDVFPGDFHSTGQIWSRALFDINRNLGRNVGTRVIVEAHFWMNPKVQFKQAARITVETARKLEGNAAAQTVRAAFADRGIL